MQPTVKSFFSLVLLLAVVCFGSTTRAQQRCGTAEYELFQKNNRIYFENWLRRKAERLRETLSPQRTQASPYIIPIVVHVIHNGEPVGIGTNISDAQILSQIEVLNNDYKRLNVDAANTPAEFAAVAGSLDITFVLARQDPEGVPSNGIVRVKSPKSGWTFEQDVILKSLSYWPAEDYLNLWVVNLTDEFVGYAKFPDINLPGNIEPNTERLVDGVVIHYTAFGTSDAGSFNLEPKFDKGRTATHEIGHFFGLRHIWGDANCGNDFVDDTPAQQTSTNGCPNHPSTANCSGSTTKMFQNFLDYTDDRCMNLFTRGQVDRMTIILENSPEVPRRKSLLTSKGAIAPVYNNNDGGISKIVAPTPSFCGGAYVPTVSIRNFGPNLMTSIRVAFSVNSVLVETRDFSGLALTQYAATHLTFATHNISTVGASTVRFEILQVNGTTDPNSANNIATQVTTVPQTIAAPYLETFNALPPNWSVINPDNNISWQNVVAANASPSNRAMVLNFFDYELEGAADQLTSPVIDLTSATFALLRFDRAYARFPGKNLDSLNIFITTDCGADFSAATRVFSRGGSLLATAADRPTPFIPSSAAQWVTETISLSAFAGQKVQLVFQGVNGYGNRLYIDNVSVSSGNFNDISIGSIASPSPVVCISNPALQFTVQNGGSTAVNRVTVSVRRAGQEILVQLFDNLQLASGSQTELTLNPINLTEGENALTITIADPDASDDLPDNNTRNYTVVLSNNADFIPFRKDFSESAETWTVISQGQQARWQPASTNFGSSVRYAAFQNTNVGEEAWLVSPVIDASALTEASLFFDASYATRNVGVERLRVLASENCGVTFTEILLDKAATDFGQVSSSSDWLPATAADWQRQYISISQLAGKKNLRFAFVVENQNGNNLFLDNIETFVIDNPDPPRIEKPFAVYSSPTNPYEINFTFNLPERAPIRIQVYNLVGQRVTENSLAQTLNQTFSLDFTGQAAGVYIVRLQVGESLESFKVFIGP